MNYSQLVPYGIQNDQSDYRIHVGFESGMAYVFPTSNARIALDPQRHRPFAATQPGVGGKTTGAGFRVPWRDIADCREITIPHSLLVQYPCQRDDLPQVKGRAAVAIAVAILREGLIALPSIAHDTTDIDIQIRGVDLIVTSRLTIQCKCDWSCTRLGLAIQTAESNPLHRY